MKEWGKSKSLSLAGPGLITGLLALSVLSCSPEETGPVQEVVRPVKTLVLEDSGAGDARSYPGRVRAAERAVLTFKVSGPLVELPVNEGDLVEKDRLLARIDPRDFQTTMDKIQSELQQAEAQLQAMKTGARPEDVKVLEAEVAAAKARYQKAQQEFSRYAGLFERDMVSKSEYDTAMSARDVAKAQLETAIQNLEKGRKGAREEDIQAKEAEIRGLEARLKETRDALEDTRLTAPFKGVVATKYVENFQNVQAKEAIVSLQDIADLEVVFNAPEQMLAARRGEDCYKGQVIFQGAPGKTYEAVLKEYSAEADPQTQTYEIVVGLPAPEDLTILPGMTATVKVVDECAQEEGQFLVPVSAVFADEEKRSFVWVVQPDSMTVRPKEVKVGDLAGNSVRVLEGLEAGERIVTAGTHLLVDGMKVRLMEGRQ